MNPATWPQRTTKPVPQAPALMCGENLEANSAEFARRAAAIAPAQRSSHVVCLFFCVDTNRSG